MQNTNKNRRGKVAAIFLALLVTATAVPAMSISAFAAENNNTGISTQAAGGASNQDTANSRADSMEDMPTEITGLTYAYDASRGSSSFKNAVNYTVLGKAYVDPKSASEGSAYGAVLATSSKLNCTLTKLGKYETIKNEGKTINVATSVLNELKNCYSLDSLTSLDDFTIYELKGIDKNIYSEGNENELRHIAYGIILSYNDTNGEKTVFFIGWMGNSSMAWGMLLSSTELQTRQTVSTTINVYPLNNKYTTTTPTTPTEQRAQITKKPKVKGSNSYTGRAYELVEAGTAEHGEMQYAVTSSTEDTAPTEESEWSSEIPTRTEIGSYKIWYKAKATENGYIDSEPYFCGTYTISKNILALGGITFTSYDYDGKSHRLAQLGGLGIGGTPNIAVPTGTIKYYGKRVELDDNTTPTAPDKNDGGWVTNHYSSIETGIYHIWAKIDDADTNHFNYKYRLENLTDPSDPIYVGSATIRKATPDVDVVGKTGLKYNNGNEQTLVTTTKKDNGTYTVQYQVVPYVNGVAADASTNESDWKDTATATDAGDYKVYYRIKDANYTEVQDAVEKVSIGKASTTIAYHPYAKTITYNGSSRTLVVADSKPNHGTIEYAVTDTRIQNPYDIPADVEWTTAIPERTDAGSYKVWYRVTGDGNYLGISPRSAGTAVINRATVTVTPPTPLENLTYNGNEQDIAKPGSLSCTATKADGNFFTSDDFGKLVYAVTAASAENCPATLFDNVPKETEVGEYKVWYGVGNVTDQKKNFKYVLADGSEITGYDNYIEASIKEKESTSSGGGGSTVTTYSITFNTNGGSPVQTQHVVSGSKLSNLPTTTKEGCTFAGWYTDEALTQPFSADTAIAKNTVLYAKWTEKADPTDPGEGVTVGQVTGLKAIKKTTTTLKLTFNKVEGASGYEIYDAETNELLTTGTTQKGADKLVKTITGLNAGEVRKYKVRAYVIVNGEKRYGAFSKVYTKATAERTPVLLATAVKTTGTSVKLRWTPVDGAAKYQVYGGVCSEIPVRLKTVSGETTDWTSKSLKRATSYKYYVVALDEAGKKIATAPIIHVVTNGSKYGNPEQLTLTSDAAITMTKGGKVANVLTELTASPAEKEPLTHIAALRYRSDDKTVAKVDKDGVITAVNKGTCTVYVIAQNGLYQAVTVTVE